MTACDLFEKVKYSGMEKDARKLALYNKLASAEEIAVMSVFDVCSLLAPEFEIVHAEPERVVLVHKNKLAEYEKLVNIISR